MHRETETETERGTDLKPFLLRKGIHPLVEITNIIQIRPQGMFLDT